MILYDSKLPIVQQLGVGNQIIPDLNGLLATLKGKKIYTIARLSVFWDQGLTGVTVGSRVQLDIPAKLAYGDHPSGGQPAGALRFVVDVLAAS